MEPGKLCTCKKVSLLSLSLPVHKDNENQLARAQRCLFFSFRVSQESWIACSRLLDPLKKKKKALGAPLGLKDDDGLPGELRKKKVSLLSLSLFPCSLAKVQKKTLDF